MVNVWARTTLAVAAQLVTPIAMMIVNTPPAEHRRQHDGQHQARDHQEEIDDPQDDGLQPAGEVPGGHPHDGADDHRHRRRGETDQQRDTGSPDQHAQHVPTGRIGAEDVGAARRFVLPRGDPDHVQIFQRLQDRGEQRDHHHRQQQGETDNPGPGAGEFPPATGDLGAAPARDAGALDGGRRLSGLGRGPPAGRPAVFLRVLERRTHAAHSRGSSTRYTRSATKFMMITIAEKTTKVPCSNGRSGALRAWKVR